MELRGTPGAAGSRIAEEDCLMTTEPWVSVDDIATHLGVAKDSVYRWLEHKGMPGHKMGRLWKFKVSEVDEWVRVGGAGAEGPSSTEEEDRG